MMKLTAQYSIRILHSWWVNDFSSKTVDSLWQNKSGIFSFSIEGAQAILVP